MTKTAPTAAPAPVRDIPIGTLVTYSARWNGMPYAGPCDVGDGFVSMSARGIAGPMSAVAPTGEIVIRPKDPAITAVKTNRLGYIPWSGYVNGELVGEYRTKRDAIADAAIQLAIRAWHAAGPDQAA